MIRNVLTGVSHSQEELCVLGGQTVNMGRSVLTPPLYGPCPCLPSLRGDPFEFLPLTLVLQIHHSSDVIYQYHESLEA